VILLRPGATKPRICLVLPEAQLGQQIEVTLEYQLIVLGTVRNLTAAE
jgi:hypothetical protein